MAGHTAARLIAQDYLVPLKEMDVDVLILGCTHYPLMRDLIADVMGAGVRLVDSATETAREVAGVLDEADLRTDAAEPPDYAFAASDAPLRFRDVGRRFVGDVIEEVEQVDVEGVEHAA